MTARALPRPLAGAGVVRNDPGTRTLTVRPAPDASGTVKLIWRKGVAARARADEAPTMQEAIWAERVAPTVWASGAGERIISQGQPTADNALAFTFRVGDPVYRKLVSTPGLRAYITVDRVTRQILGVRFRGRAWPA